MLGKGFFLAFLLLFTLIDGSGAEDWPMWRYDASRSASSPQVLPEKLHLQWVREYPPLVPGWEDPLNQDLMQFDRVYEPVLLGETLLVGSSVGDRLVALDAASGEERWSFYAAGPVRLPPVAKEGKVYFASDDGYLYCVDVDTGSLLWKFRGSPGDRKLLGNSRLVSTWPARGGPVLKDGVVYFAAGIWPFMGVFVHALDAQSGDLVWTNDSSGSLYMLQPHNSPAYGGVAPQGSLVISGDRLLVPCGRSVPACFDLKTGEFLYYKLSQYNKTGGAFVCAVGDRFVNYHRDRVTSLYDLRSGDALIPRFGGIPAVTKEALFCAGDSIVAFDLNRIRQVEYDKQVRDRKTKEYKTVVMTKWVMDPLWISSVDGSGDLIKAGKRLYAGGRNGVSALELSADAPPTVSWQADIDGTVGRLIAAADRLFVVTLEGRIYAFGADSAQTRQHPYAIEESRSGKSRTKEAQNILETTGVRDGYCLVYGLEEGGLVEALARLSDLRIIAVDRDADRVERLRRAFAAAGLYGSRISVQVGDPFSFEAPPYVASLTVFEEIERAGYDQGASFLQKIYHSMRPYGGIACFAADKTDELQGNAGDLPQARVRSAGGLALLSREGPLPGSADWTHQYGDVANTVKSDDELVRLPLGVLWFGGNSHVDVLPRHGHGPPEQVLDGRLFIEGIDCLSARDVYTGRVLWKRTFADLGNYGVYYDSTYANTPLSTAYNQVHIPGANARGTNFVVTSDRVYLARGSGCLVLDPVSGETLDEIRLPGETEDEPAWGYIGVYEDYLIAGTGAVRYTDFLDLSPEEKRKSSYNLNTTSSRNLVVLNRYSGEVLWSYTSTQGLRHNAIVAGDGKVFCIDRMSTMVADALKRRGKKVAGKPTLMAFDVGSGEGVWRTTKGVFGTWLGYSKEYDVLLQAGRKTRDTVVDEPKSGMIAYRGKDGRRLWSNDEISYGGPCILHGATIITDRYAYDLLNGGQKMRYAPLTGSEEPWAFARRYGCNYNVASEYLLTFRSAAAGYYDLEHDGGTGNFGGFKAGCTSNLIAANGVLNAPDYTRTCACSYQNQTSLALVHMPDVELWVTYLGESGDGPIREIGVNLGAPGNRRAADGCFWIANPLLPHVSEPEKESGLSVGISVDVERGGFYTRHASSIAGGDGPDWIAASGCRGISRLELDLRAPQKATYEVSLHFAEPDGSAPGERVFDVLIEGRRMLEDFDISAQAGGPNRALVRTFAGVAVDDGKLTLEFVAARSDAKDVSSLPLLCGLKAVQEVR